MLGERTHVRDWLCVALTIAGAAGGFAVGLAAGGGLPRGVPAAVAMALDARITGGVITNFGGPQPESPYPLPRDAEPDGLR